MPDGFVEVMAPDWPFRSDDDSLPAESALNKWSSLMQRASIRLKRPIDVAPQISQLMYHAGQYFRACVQMADQCLAKERRIQGDRQIRQPRFIRGSRGLQLEIFSQVALNGTNRRSKYFAQS
jgi:hypothetical protein